MTEFATSIHCIDGRIQQPLIGFLITTFNIRYIDAITEPAPCKGLSDDSDPASRESILRRVNTSIRAHDTQLLFVSAHYDCAANPVSEAVQLLELNAAAAILGRIYPDMKIVRLWLNENFSVLVV